VLSISIQFSSKPGLPFCPEDGGSRFIRTRLGTRGFEWFGEHDWKQNAGTATDVNRYVLTEWVFNVCPGVNKILQRSPVGQECPQGVPSLHFLSNQLTVTRPCHSSGR
jgi:hypothetical protein